MDNHTDSTAMSGPSPQSLLLQLGDGTYVLLPNIAELLQQTDAKGMMVDDDFHIWVLRQGLKKGRYRWVPITDEDD